MASAAVGTVGNARTLALTALPFTVRPRFEKRCKCRWGSFDEDAGFDELDYTGQRLGIQLSQRFTARSREITLKTELRAESRDYRAVTPSIGELRRDNRRQLGLTVEIPAGQRVVMRIAIRRADNESNLASVDFAETVGSIAFGAKL